MLVVKGNKEPALCWLHGAPVFPLLRKQRISYRDPDQLSKSWQNFRIDSNNLELTKLSPTNRYSPGRRWTEMNT